MEKRILVLGSTFTEFVMHIDRIPLANEVGVEYGKRETIAGGTGFNMAAAFARLNADTVLCTKVGEDAQGAALVKAIGNFGIDTRFVVEDKKGKSGFNAVLAESNGVSRTISYPGCAYDVSDTEAEEAMTCYPDALYMTMELGAKTVISTADLAESNGIPIYFEADIHDAKFPFSRLPQLEAFIVDADAAYYFTKVTTDTLENYLRAALKLSSMVDAKHYIIKLGERGSYSYDGTYQRFIPAQNVVVADHRGAGEVFSAALTLGYVEGGDMESAMKYATYASAVALSREGRITSYPTNDDIEKYLSQNETD